MATKETTVRNDGQAAMAKLLEAAAGITDKTERKAYIDAGKKAIIELQEEQNAGQAEAIQLEKNKLDLDKKKGEQLNALRGQVDSAISTGSGIQKFSNAENAIGAQLSKKGNVLVDNVPGDVGDVKQLKDEVAAKKDAYINTERKKQHDKLDNSVRAELAKTPPDMVKAKKLIKDAVSPTTPNPNNFLRNEDVTDIEGRIDAKQLELARTTFDTDYTNLKNTTNGRITLLRRDIDAIAPAAVINIIPILNRIGQAEQTIANFESTHAITEEEVKLNLAAMKEKLEQLRQDVGKAKDEKEGKNKETRKGNTETQFRNHLRNALTRNTMVLVNGDLVNARAVVDGALGAQVITDEEHEKYLTSIQKLREEKLREFSGIAAAALRPQIAAATINDPTLPTHITAVDTAIHARRAELIDEDYNSLMNELRQRRTDLQGEQDRGKGDREKLKKDANDAMVNRLRRGGDMGAPYNLAAFDAEVATRGDLTPPEQAALRDEGRRQLREERLRIQNDQGEVATAKQDVLNKMSGSTRAVGGAPPLASDSISAGEARLQIGANNNLTELEKQHIYDAIDERERVLRQVDNRGDALRAAGRDLRVLIRASGISNEMKEAMVAELDAMDQEQIAQGNIDTARGQEAEAKRLTFELRRGLNVLRYGGMTFALVGAGLFGPGILGVAGGAGGLALGGLALGSGASLYDYLLGNGRIRNAGLHKQAEEQTLIIANIQREAAKRRIGTAQGETGLMARLYAQETGRDPNEMMDVWLRRYGLLNVNEMQAEIEKMGVKAA